MPRDPEQGDKAELATRRFIARELERAYQNTDRPRARNRRAIALWRELQGLYALDATERAAKAAS